MFTSAVLLAAGSAKRMGADKLQLPYKGQLLLDRALAPLMECETIDEVIVVVRPAFPSPVADRKCRIVFNPEHQEGLGSSLRVGVAAASPAADVFVVALADMPEITAEIVEELLGAFCRSGKQTLVPGYQRRNGHPVVFASAWREALLRMSGDLGARAIIGEHPQMVEYYPTDHRAVVYDVDRREDMECRCVTFRDADTRRRVAVALEHAGVYFRATDAADSQAPALEYYPFDEAKVAAICRDDSAVERRS